MFNSRPLKEKKGDYFKELMRFRVCVCCHSEFRPGFRPQRGNINDKFCPACRANNMPLLLYRWTYPARRQIRSESQKKHIAFLMREHWKRMSPEKKKEIGKLSYKKKKERLKKDPAFRKKIKEYARNYYQTVTKHKQGDLEALNKARSLAGLKEVEKLPNHQRDLLSSC